MRISLALTALFGLLSAATASTDTVSVGSVNLTRADRDKFVHESKLRGNASMQHVAAWVGHQNRFEHTVCHNATFQMLSHGRFIETNYTDALSYGAVLGNVTAKSSLCSVPYMDTHQLLPANTTGHVGGPHARRWFESLFGAATMWASIFDFAGELFGAGCAIYDLAFGLNKTGNLICNGASLVTAIGGGWDFVDNVRSAATATVAQPSYNDFGVIPLGPLSGYQIGSFEPFSELGIDPDKKRRGAGSSINYTATTFLRHGTENRNLTWFEYATANSTHRSSFWYDGKNGGMPAAFEFWHQPHPVNASKWTTHLGLNLSQVVNDPSSSVARKERRQNSDDLNVNDWCNGGYARSGWEPADDDFIIWECNEDDNNGESVGGGPGMLYYGLDAYAPNENSAFSWDMGVSNTENNGFGQAVQVITGVTDITNCWDQCICLQENGQWMSTGTLQYSWDNTYNGYSRCWEANCGDPNGSQT